MNQVVLAVRDLVVEVDADGRRVRAVDGVSLELERGKTIGLLGESGCGKSMAALAVMDLLPPSTRRASGSAELTVGGQTLPAWRARGDRIAMIFQEPASALNPVLTAGTQIEEVHATHGGCSRAEARQRTLRSLAEVGFPDARAIARRYPHELSGGMCQRVMVAMALASQPDVLIADEPTTALDTTLAAQALTLLAALQRSRHMSMLLISHDFATLRALADEVAVMYAGRIVERGLLEQVFEAPRHPYTQALLSSRPQGLAPQTHLPCIPGTVPRLGTVSSGCAFRERCVRSRPECATSVPELRDDVACHFPLSQPGHVDG